MLKVIDGDRAALEALALKTIWLGDQDDADRLLARLKRHPGPKLTVVKDGQPPQSSPPLLVPKTE